MALSMIEFGLQKSPSCHFVEVDDITGDMLSTSATKYALLKITHSEPQYALKLFILLPNKRGS